MYVLACNAAIQEIQYCAIRCWIYPPLMCQQSTQYFIVLGSILVQAPAIFGAYIIYGVPTCLLTN